MATKLSLSKELKTFAKEKGADLVGIANVERFAGAPEGHRPQDFLPDAKAVISLGMRMNRSVCRALRNRKSIYSHAGLGTIHNNRLDEITYLTARFLENQGYDAYPINAFFPADIIRLKGDISHKHAAVAAGLGEIGWNNLFLSPQFGPRQQLASIITNATLKADPLFEGKLCDPPKCGYQCIVCPTGAIRKTEKKSFKIGERIFEHRKHSKWRCVWGCGSYSAVKPLPATRPTIGDMFDAAEEMEKLKYRGSLDETTLASVFLTRINEGEIPWCWLACLTHCPVGL